MSPIQTCFSFPSDDCDNAMHEDSSEFLKKKKRVQKVILKGVGWMQKFRRWNQ